MHLSPFSSQLYERMLIATPVSVRRHATQRDKSKTITVAKKAARRHFSGEPLVCGDSRHGSGGARVLITGCA